MTYTISEKARDELRQIWRYTTRNWSEEQADLYIGLLRDEIEFLAANPGKGRNFSHRGKNYKYSQVKSHLIFYKELSDSEIEITRILHKRMDIGNRLSD
jgi:toxin ParE1/3/4